MQFTFGAALAIGLIAETGVVTVVDFVVVSIDAVVVIVAVVVVAIVGVRLEAGGSIAFWPYVMYCRGM